MEASGLTNCCQALLHFFCLAILCTANNGPPPLIQHAQYHWLIIPHCYAMPLQQNFCHSLPGIAIWCTKPTYIISLHRALGSLPNNSSSNWGKMPWAWSDQHQICCIPCWWEKFAHPALLIACHELTWPYLGMPNLCILGKCWNVGLNCYTQQCPGGWFGAMQQPLPLYNSQLCHPAKFSIPPVASSAPWLPNICFFWQLIPFWKHWWKATTGPQPSGHPHRIWQHLHYQWWRQRHCLSKNQPFKWKSVHWQPLLSQCCHFNPPLIHFATMFWHTSSSS